MYLTSHMHVSRKSLACISQVTCMYLTSHMHVSHKSLACISQVTRMYLKSTAGTFLLCKGINGFPLLFIARIIFVF